MPIKIALPFHKFAPGTLKRSNAGRWGGREGGRGGGGGVSNDRHNRDED